MIHLGSDFKQAACPAAVSYLAIDLTDLEAPDLADLDRWHGATLNPAQYALLMNAKVLGDRGDENQGLRYNLRHSSPQLRCAEESRPDW